MSVKSDESIVRGFDQTKETFAVDVKSSKSSSAFGDQRVSQVVPLCGWTFAYGINPAIVRTITTGDGTVTGADSQAVLSTGAAPNSTARIETIKTNRYIPGEGGLFRFTAPFNGPHPTGYQKAGLFTADNGWGFGYDADRFGIFKIRAGVTEWVYQEDWNGDTFPGFDPTLGIPFEGAFQWLGYGAQAFKAALPDGSMVTLHTIEYSNTSTDVSVRNPNLPLAVEIDNGAAGGDVVVTTPSGMAGLEGDALNEANSLVIANDSVRVLATGVDQPIISYYNPPTFNGQVNQLFVQPLRLNLVNVSAQPSIFRVYANAIPTDGVFVPLNPAISPIEQNTTFTSFNGSGGILIFAAVLNAGDTQVFDLVNSKFFGYPDQYFTIVAQTLDATTVYHSLSFRQFL